MILLKVTTGKNVWFATMGFKIMDSNFKILYAMVVVIWQCQIITIKNVEYRCIIYNISKCETVNLLINSVLEDCGYI